MRFESLIRRGAQYVHVEGSPSPQRDAREISRQLEEWRNQNFEDMPAIAKAYVGKEVPQENLELAPVILRACTDHAAQYKRPVRRTWDKVTDAQRAELTRLYAELGVDVFMPESQKRQYPQNALAIGLLPSLDHPGRATLVSWIWADVVSHDMGRDPRERDLRYAAEIRFSHPWRLDSGEYRLVDLVFTRTEAYYALDEDVRVGVYREDLANPFAPLLPVFGVRTALPTADGSWWPHPAQDMWAAQVISACAGTDCLRQIQVMSPGLQVLTGTGVQNFATKGKGKRGEGPQITRGPENMLLIPVRTSGEEAPATFAYHELKPQTEAYLAAKAAYLGEFASYRYLDVEAIRGGESAEAAREQRSDVYAYRLSQEALWREAEAQLAWLITGWHNSRSPLQLPRDGLRVAFQYPKKQSNDLQAAQAMFLLSALGLTDLVDELETPGEDLPYDERAKRVAELVGKHLALVERLRGYVPPGLDEIADQTGLRSDDKPAAAGGGGAEDVPGAGVAETAPNALNGAQIQAVLEVAGAVGAGTISVSGGVAILRDGLGLGDDTARAILAGATAPQEPQP